MSGISAQYADGLELRIKELGEQVEKLTKERDEYRLKYQLKTPVLNRIKAETLEAFKVELMHLVANGEASISEISVAVDAFDKKYEKEEGL